MDGYQMDIYDCIEVAEHEAACDDCPDPALCQAQGCMEAESTLSPDIYPPFDA